MMKFERLLLVAFFGNYIINTIIAAFVALVPPSQTPGLLTAQYITFVIAAAVTAGIFTWWYLRGMTGGNMLARAGIFGAGAFIIAIATTFVSGTANVLMQSGSFAQVVSVIPNFGPFLMNWTTLALLGYWVIPALVVGFLVRGRGTPSMM